MHSNFSCMVRQVRHLMKSIRFFWSSCNCQITSSVMCLEIPGLTHCLSNHITPPRRSNNLNHVPHQIAAFRLRIFNFLIGSAHCFHASSTALRLMTQRNLNNQIGNIYYLHDFFDFFLPCTVTSCFFPAMIRFHNEARTFKILKDEEWRE